MNNMWVIVCSAQATTCKVKY